MGFRLGGIFAVVAVALALLVGTAVADSGVSTGAATRVKEHSAVLHGHLASDNAGAAWFFEWGTTRDVSSQSSPKTTRPVELKLTELRPDTKYYFRVVVIEGGYIPTFVFGSIRDFTTK